MICTPGISTSMMDSRVPSLSCPFIYSRLDPSDIHIDELKRWNESDGYLKQPATPVNLWGRRELWSK